MSESDDIQLKGWQRSHGIMPKSNGGFIGRLKSGVKSRIDERVEDLNQRIEHPKEWREKHHKESVESMGRQIKELKLQSKIDRLNAGRSRSQATIRKNTPSYDMGIGGSGGGLFDLGGGGGGGLFDLGGGGGSGSSVPLFDLETGGGSGLFDMGMGSKPKKKKANKKNKSNNSKGIHIHIGK